jgi:hypothetical protein
MARHYDPATAQFLTVDPKVAATLSPYGYLGGNPLNGSDPSGECGGPFGFVCTAWNATAGKVVNYAQQHPLQAAMIVLGVVAVGVGVALTGGAGLALVAAAGEVDTSTVVGFAEAYEFYSWAAPVVMGTGLLTIASGVGLIYMGATSAEAANTDAYISGGASGCSTR